MAADPELPPKLGLIFSSIAEEEVGEVNRLLIDGYPVREIADALARNGHSVGETTLKTYRQKIKEVVASESDG